MTFPLSLLGRADEVIEGDEVIEAPTACPGWHRQKPHAPRTTRCIAAGKRRGEVPNYEIATRSARAGDGGEPCGNSPSNSFDQDHADVRLWQILLQKSAIITAKRLTAIF
jgi:hypothetical protein